jgi:hypothetical protein
MTHIQEYSVTNKATNMKAKFMNAISNFARAVLLFSFLFSSSAFAQGVATTSTPQTRADGWVDASFVGSLVLFLLLLGFSWLAHSKGAIGFLKGKASRLLPAVGVCVAAGAGIIFYSIGLLSGDEATVVSADKLAWTLVWPIAFFLLFGLIFTQIKKSWNGARPVKQIADANSSLPVTDLEPKPEAPLVIYIGGTGVDIALMHLRLRAIVGGELAKIVVLDYDTNPDAQSGAERAPRIATLQKLSLFLRGSIQAISVIPIVRPGGGKSTLPEMLDLAYGPQDMRPKALSWLVPPAWDELRATEGAYRRPAFGATVLALSLSQANSLQEVFKLSEATFKAGKSVTIVAGISGGTGPSSAPSIAQRLIPLIGTQGGNLHVVAVPSWFAVSGMHEANKELKANRNATLNYFGNEQVFKNPSVKLHVLQWPHIVERQFAGDKQQPEDPHYFSSIVASVVMDIERGYSGLASTDAGRALTLRAHIENQQLGLDSKSPVLAIPASGEGQGYLTLNQVLEMAAAQEASLTTLAGLLSTSGDSWSSGLSSLFALETPKAVASWIKRFESERQSEDNIKSRKDLRDLIAGAATDFTALVADPLRKSVNALNTTVTLKDAPSLVLEVLKADEAIKSEAGLAIYGYSQKGNSLRWLVHRTVSEWSEDMLVNSISNYSLNSDKPEAGDYCRTLARELLRSVSKMFKPNVLTADTANKNYGWFIPLAPNSKSAVNGSARYGHFDLVEMLRDGGQRFDGRASSPSDGAEFEMYAPPNADSHPVSFPERKIIALGLAAKPDSLQHSHAKNRLIGMYFAMANGSVRKTSISQLDVGEKLWKAMMNAIKADSLFTANLPTKLDAYNLPDGTPFALLLPKAAGAWVLASNKASAEHVDAWINAYQITTQAASVGNAIAKKVLGSFVSFINNAGNEVPENQKDLLLSTTNAAGTSWIDPSAYLLNEHWITYPVKDNSKAAMGDDKGELLIKGLRSLAPVKSDALDKYVDVHYGGAVRQDRVDDSHYFFIELKEVAAFVFSRPRMLADGNTKNPVFAAYAYPSAPNAKSVRVGMLNLNKGLWLQGIGQQLKHAGRSNYANAIFAIDGAALALRSADGAELGLVKMPEEITPLISTANNLAVVLDFGTSNSSILAAAYSSTSPEQFKMLNLPLRAVADVSMPCLIDSELGFRDAPNDYAGFSPWVSLSKRSDYSYLGCGVEAATQAALHSSMADFPKESPGTSAPEVWSAAKDLDIVPFPISLPKSDGMAAVDFSHARSVLKFIPKQGGSELENQLRQSRSAYILQMLWPTFLYLRSLGYTSIARLIVTRPGAMDDTFANRFISDVQAIAENIGEQIGITCSQPVESCLEGVAAAQMLSFAGSLEHTDLNLVIDVGGGTTDYQLTHKRSADSAAGQDVSFSWSMRWAGKMIEDALANNTLVREIIQCASNMPSALELERAKLMMPYALRDETTRGKIKDLLDNTEHELRNKVEFFFKVILDVAVRALAVGIDTNASSRPKVNLALVGGAWQLYSLIATPNGGGRSIEEFIQESLGCRYGFPNIIIKNYSGGDSKLGLSGKSVIGYGALSFALSNSTSELSANFNDRGCPGLNLRGTNSVVQKANEFCTSPFPGRNVADLLSSVTALDALLSLPLPTSQTQPGNQGTCLLDATGRVPYSGSLTDEQVINRLSNAAVLRKVDTWPILIFVEDVLKPFFEQP